MNFTKKNIWITGAASGIGKAVALQLSKEYTNLILSDIDEKGLKRVANLCEANNCTTLIVPIDLSDQKLWPWLGDFKSRIPRDILSSELIDYQN